MREGKKVGEKNTGVPLFLDPPNNNKLPPVVTPSIKLRVERTKKVFAKVSNFDKDRAHLHYLSLSTTFHLVTVQVLRTEIVGIEKSAFAEEYSSAAGSVGGDAGLPPRRGDAAAAVCCWYPVNVGRVD